VERIIEVVTVAILCGAGDRGNPDGASASRLAAVRNFPMPQWSSLL